MHRMTSRKQRGQQKATVGTYKQRTSCYHRCCSSQRSSCSTTSRLLHCCTDHLGTVCTQRSWCLTRTSQRGLRQPQPTDTPGTCSEQKALQPAIMDLSLHKQRRQKEAGKVILLRESVPVAARTQRAAGLARRRKLASGTRGAACGAGGTGVGASRARLADRRAGGGVLPRHAHATAVAVRESDHVAVTSRRARCAHRRACQHHAGQR